MANNIQISSAQLGDSQITTDKINNDAVTADKVDLAAGSYDFSAGSADVKVKTQSAGNNSVLAASTAYVDTAYSAGAGVLDTSNKFSIDLNLATAGLTFSGAGDSGLLQISFESSNPTLKETGGQLGVKFVANGFNQSAAGLSLMPNTSKGIDIDSDGIKVQTGDGITLSGGKVSALADDAASVTINDSVGIQVVVKDLGGILHDGTNGLALRLDSTMLEIDSSSKDLQIKANSITMAKMKFTPHYEEYTGSATDTFTFGSSRVVPSGYNAIVQVYKNGLRMSYDESASSNNEYALNGARTAVVFGAAVLASDLVQVQYIAE